MNIKEYCNRFEVKLTHLAKEIPCTQPHLSMIANGKSRPGWEMAKRIEQVTNGHVKTENWYNKDNTPIGQQNDDLIAELDNEQDA